MLTLQNVKTTFFTNVYNKFLSTSYFVNKKYDETCLKEYFLLLELSNVFNDEFTEPSQIKLIDMSNLGTITINNIFNNIVQSFQKIKYTCTGSEGNTISFPILIGLPYIKIFDFERGGVSATDITNNVGVAVSQDVDYNNVLGKFLVDAGNPFVIGEKLTIIFNN